MNKREVQDSNPAPSLQNYKNRCHEKADKNIKMSSVNAGKKTRVSNATRKFAKTSRPAKHKTWWHKYAKIRDHDCQRNAVINTVTGTVRSESSEISIDGMNSWSLGWTLARIITAKRTTKCPTGTAIHMTTGTWHATVTVKPGQEPKDSRTLTLW